MLVHSLFDVLALLTALAVFRVFPVSAPGLPPQPWRVHRLYLAVGSFGATSGAYLAGSANLWLTGIDGVGRSIEGAIAGAVVAIEALKALTGIRGSTGLSFVAPLAAAIAVGRIGCFLAGLDDMTYGTPTALPWGVDFGDGVPRHPVQLYESATIRSIGPPQQGHWSSTRSGSGGHSSWSLVGANAVSSSRHSISLSGR